MSGIEIEILFSATSLRFRVTLVQLSLSQNNDFISRRGPSFLTYRQSRPSTSHRRDTAWAQVLTALHLVLAKMSSEKAVQETMMSR